MGLEGKGGIKRRKSEIQTCFFLDFTEDAEQRRLHPVAVQGVLPAKKKFKKKEKSAPKSMEINPNWGHNTGRTGERGKSWKKWENPGGKWEFLVFLGGV